MTFSSLVFFEAGAFTAAVTLLSDHEGCMQSLPADDMPEFYAPLWTIRRHNFISSVACILASSRCLRPSSRL